MTETYRLRVDQGASVDNADFSGSETAWLVPGRQHQDLELVRFRWLRLLEMYVSCGMTVADDRLIALAGLARAFSAHLGEYHAGIWGGDFLVQCLIWSTIRFPESPKAPSKHRG